MGEPYSECDSQEDAEEVVKGEKEHLANRMEREEVVYTMYIKGWPTAGGVMGHFSALCSLSLFIEEQAFIKDPERPESSSCSPSLWKPASC